MAEESDLEKTEAASPRRKEKAREQGQVARSRELGTFVLLATGAAVIWAMGTYFYQSAQAIIRASLLFDPRVAQDASVMVALAVRCAGQAIWLLLPLFAFLAVAAIGSALMLGGIVFSSSAFAFKVSKLNPLSGLKRMVSTQMVAELFKAVAKVLLVASVGGCVIWLHHDEMLRLMYAAPPEALARMMSVVALCSTTIIGSLLIIVMLDVPWQIWTHLKKLRMSKEDVRQEHKENEGDPHLKARIRQQQRANARRRMMSDVPSADVIVTNPTHYAVALQYNDQARSAPKVIAKGMGEIAARIRELGQEHAVPILSAAPLARALHKHVEIGQEIPATLYAAVAEVLAWVFKLRVWQPGAGPHPGIPESLPVPHELDPLYQGRENTTT